MITDFNFIRIMHFDKNVAKFRGTVNAIQHYLVLAVAFHLFLDHEMPRNDDQRNKNGRYA